ncbi:hypothetical protein MUP01_10115 [Candidatus Bathyarchaeota archaeon]|nr:hypothetical protein [Candidatus Bathyarchaeota archaeon]
MILSSLLELAEFLIWSIDFFSMEGRRIKSDVLSYNNEIVEINREEFTPRLTTDVQD